MHDYSLGQDLLYGPQPKGSLFGIADRLSSALSTSLDGLFVYTIVSRVELCYLNINWRGSSLHGIIKRRATLPAWLHHRMHLVLLMSTNRRSCLNSCFKERAPPFGWLYCGLRSVLSTSTDKLCLWSSRWISPVDWFCTVLSQNFLWRLLWA